MRGWQALKAGWAGLKRSVLSSFSKKLLFSYLVMIILPVCVGSIYILKLMDDKYAAEYKENVKTLTVKVGEGANNAIDQSRRFLNMIRFDNNMTSLLQFDHLSDLYRIETLAGTIVPMLEQTALHNPLVQHIEIYHDNKNMAWEAYNYLFYRPGYRDVYTWLPTDPKGRTELASPDYIHIETYRPEASNYAPPVGQLPQLLTLYAPIISYNGFHVVGVIEMHLRYDVLSKLTCGAGLDTYGITGLVRSDGQLLCTSGTNAAGLELMAAAAELPPQAETIKRHGDQYDIISHTIGSLDAKLLVLVPKSAMSARPYYPAFLTVLCVGILLFTIVAFMITKLILRRLLALSHIMRKVDGNLNVRVEISGEDEISGLAGHFQDMLVRTDGLIRHLERANRAEKEALIRSLENQMNPHFLCNALDWIRMTAEVSGQPRISSATALIGKYLMYNTRIDENDLPLRDELNNVNRYVDIYNLIKNDAIRLIIRTAPELADRQLAIRVQKYLLQPIVENAIKHGFLTMKANCSILIEVSLEGESLFIRIQDNGCGIGPDKLRELRENLRSGDGAPDGSRNGGVGLRNIRERMRLNYGDEADMEIESLSEMGTLVTLRLPARVL